ncbi:FAA-hydrolase domain-containing protein [Fusarium keratoplasticum]|uniref:FAA-hydrolase domain-containing protein n=1 Tax=Fusarium keratoplasticum TaxID=1328300 RepID=A0ACC0R937_9HYPO|nr:FAA-hydrolase domain-containing protein [Fusarium keratoplasticum]KAI8675965.1 FAA-hydrolase domain-containing protein [Fusarium keratoplasticum]
MSFDRLIRFLDKEGIERYGNVEGEIPASELESKTVQLVSGSIESGFKVLDEKAELVKLLCPLPSTPIIICAGVNYKSHAKETKFPPPKKPVIFATPPDRLAGPLDDIKIHPDAQELLDYEGELSIVIGKDGYDISEDDALDYVLGYTISNDVSARNLHAIDVSGYQMGYAKSFDGFGPTGPYLVSPKLVPNPQALDLKTTVNGEVRQTTSTAQMIWSCRQLIAFASRGRTLRRGTVIMTGTPEGVGWHTNGCLKDGDVVEVSIGRLGFIRNKMVFHGGD